MSEELKQKFLNVIGNLYYTWDPETSLPVIDQYEEGWIRHPSPQSFVQDFGDNSLNKILQKEEVQIHEAYDRLQDYIQRPKWFEQQVASRPQLSKLKTNPIVYYCMEFGLIDWLQIYSGGLGVLAGDYLKEASDLGIPVIGIGIFYHHGYFHQRFDENGRQIDEYLSQDPSDMPLELVRDEEGNVIKIPITIKDHVVMIRAWKLQVGEVPLYLLDTNFQDNKLQADRMITAHLYGGDKDTRIRQEILLGIGGTRLIEKLGIDPAIFHMNEGHSGFLTLEIASTLMKKFNIGFREAIDRAHEELVFTNHTLKTAGNDTFDFELISSYLSPYCDELNTSIEEIFSLGKDDVYANGDFSMTILGFRHAKVSNAVSELHSKAAANTWPDHPLIPVTNGTHAQTWTCDPLIKLLERYLGAKWYQNPFDVDYSKILTIPHNELWTIHKSQKHRLINSLNKELHLNLNPDALTVSWSRRLASYKRPDLIISDIERMKSIVNDRHRPVQILISGKAHPKDTSAIDLLQRINQELSSAMNTELQHKVVVIPDYNWRLAQNMMAGSDVWLNTPFRYEEASGTSGMKACMNGVLQLTTLDGWTDEVNWDGIGFVIDNDDPVKSLHDSLEFKIAQIYFDQNYDGFNPVWVEMMLKSMELSLSRFSSSRMLQDYIDKVYTQVLGTN